MISTHPRDTMINKTYWTYLQGIYEYNLMEETSPQMAITVW